MIGAQLPLFLPGEAGAPQLSASWYALRDGNPIALALYERHYSAYRYRDGRLRQRMVGPGARLVLVTADASALFVWRKFHSLGGQQGICCAVFRNEGGALSSELIREAVALAWARWPGERLYTYVNPKAIRSTNPGCCFKAAGFTICGRTGKGLLILERCPDG